MQRLGRAAREASIKVGNDALDAAPVPKVEARAPGVEPERCALLRVRDTSRRRRTDGLAGAS
jgi:hypothetical protein